MAGFGARQPLAWALAKDGFPSFADLHHHDLRPGKPPKGQLVTIQPRARQPPPDGINGRQYIPTLQPSCCPPPCLLSP